jgi:hypothetical protein
MKTVIRNILIGVVLLVSAGQALAYPPDNAAVLYYKSFMLLEEPNENLKKMLSDLSKGNIGMNEQIRLYLERNRNVIKEIVTAAEIKNCDWGLDFSEGSFLVMPHFAKCRQMAYILTADVKVLAEKGDYKTALERCLTIHKMGIHVGDDTILQRLVGMALGRLANKCIMEIVPQVSGDCETLERLRWRLVDISSRYLSLKVAIAKEAEVCEQQINRENVLSYIEAAGEPCDMPKEILEGDEEFFARARDYYRSVVAKIQSDFDLPYAEAIQRLEELDKQIKKDGTERPEVMITRFLLAPAISRWRTYETRGKTHLNAIFAGIDIYLIRAKTGKLPDELPAGLPKDMFSGKDFIYEKTDSGFTLKYQGKDLTRDIVHQYEFKVVK